MGSIVLTGNDTIEINGRILSDLGTGDVATITFNGDISTSYRGKNGNVIHAKNETGKMGDVEIRVLRGSNDDKFLQNQFNLYDNDSAAYKVMYGTFNKRMGDGQGKITNDIYAAEGGIPAKMPDAKTNVEGDGEQALSIHRFRFGNISRVIS